MEFKAMSLKMCARYDYESGARGKLTGWGVISKDRNARKVSRKFRIAEGKGKNGGKANASQEGNK